MIINMPEKSFPGSQGNSALPFLGQSSSNMNFSPFSPFSHLSMDPHGSGQRGHPGVWEAAAAARIHALHHG